MRSPYLGDVKQPQEIRRGRVLGVERCAREDGVPVAACDHEGLHAHVRAQDDLRGPAYVQATPGEYCRSKCATCSI